MRWFTFAVCLLTPGIMIIAGRLMWKHCPDVNTVFGYRTKCSMKNAETWEFANTYCGKLMWKLGWILLAFSAAAPLPFFKSSEETLEIPLLLIIGVQCIALFAVIFITESALKKNFRDDGTRR